MAETIVNITAAIHSAAVNLNWPMICFGAIITIALVDCILSVNPLKKARR